MRYFVLFILLFVGTISVAAAEPTRVQADAAFDENRFGDALETYLHLRDTIAETVKSGEKRTEAWADLSARVVRCNLGLGDDRQAVQEYFLLCQAVPAEKVPLDCIPLPWFVPDDAKVGLQPHEKTAVDRLDSLKFPSPGLPATLLAAAVLSVGSDQTRRSQGLSILRNLEAVRTATPSSETSSEIRNHIALLASAFLWKQRMPMLKTAADLAPLKRNIERLPEPLCCGPYYLYGMSCRRVGDLETAVLAWMRPPIHYPYQRTLRIESLREAAQCLDKLGRADQAEKLRREADSPH